VGELGDVTYPGLEAFWSWRMQAACRTVDSALFFGGDGERPPTRRRRERRAKKICAICPVLLPCRAYALVRREAYGVWGGLSERDRARVLGESDGFWDRGFTCPTGV
jgi:WhiB family redox-sensing transcriptional regulator